MGHSLGVVLSESFTELYPNSHVVLSELSYRVMLSESFSSGHVMLPEAYSPSYALRVMLSESSSPSHAFRVIISESYCLTHAP